MVRRCEMPDPGTSDRTDETRDTPRPADGPDPSNRETRSWIGDAPSSGRGGDQPPAETERPALDHTNSLYRDELAAAMKPVERSNHPGSELLHIPINSGQNWQPKPLPVPAAQPRQSGKGGSHG